MTNIKPRKASAYQIIRASVILLGFLMTIGFSACSNDEPNPPSEGDDEEAATRTFSVYVYPGVNSEDGVVPRMTIADGHEFFTELYDPTQPDVVVYHYMNSLERVSAVMSASSKGMTIIEDDPFNGTSDCYATLINKDGSDLVISTGTYSKHEDRFNITSVRRLDSVISSEHRSISSRSDDMDFARELVMKDIITPISKVAQGEKFLKRVPYSNGVRMYLNFLGDVAVPIMESSLYSNNVEEYEALLQKKAVMIGLKKIEWVNNLIGDMTGARRIYQAALACYRDVKSYEDEYYESLQEDFVFTTTESFSYTARRAQQSSWAVYDESSLYKPTIRLINVGERSATVCGNFSNYDGRFYVTGYYLYCDGMELQKIDATLDNHMSYTFSNLAKGKTYYVTSYATVMGATYESPAVEFRIDGDLEISQSSVSFSETGGKTTVGVTPPSDKWTWSATSDAKWCKVNKKDDQTIQIEATASDESRRCLVTVTATSPDGATQTKTIEVTQTVIGNFALFRGSVTVKTDTKYPSKPQYNFVDEYKVESALTMMRMGGSTNLTFTLPFSGITFVNWTVSRTPPSGTMLADGVRVTMFECASTPTQIRLDGTTVGPDNTTNTEFTVRIDLSTLSVYILESQHSTGIGYPGMTGATEYNSHTTLSGTLNYTEDY